MSRKIPASEYMGYDKYIEDEYIVKKNPNIIEIPDNATNGDVIIAVFHSVAEDHIGEHVIAWLKDGMGWSFEREWWNAPYKREGE